MRKALTCLLLVSLLVMTGAAAVMYEYPETVEQGHIYSYCSKLDVGYEITLDTTSPYVWEAIKERSEVC